MFFFKRTKASRNAEMELILVRERARAVHQQIAGRPLELTDLFMLMGESGAPLRLQASTPNSGPGHHDNQQEPEPEEASYSFPKAELRWS